MDQGTTPLTEQQADAELNQVLQHAGKLANYAEVAGQGYTFQAGEQNWLSQIRTLSFAEKLRLLPTIWPQIADMYAAGATQGGSQRSAKQKAEPSI